ncbi:polynucleotide adenylyltransferase PcnB, partial [Enterococcus faecium]
MIRKLIKKLLGKDGQPRAGATGATGPTPPGTPVVSPVGVHGIDPSLLSKNAVRVTDTLQQAGFKAFIV